MQASSFTSYPAPTAPKNGNGAKSRMHGDDRRRQLLRVAIDVFARNGFSGTKTKDIARVAGVSEAILFRHFATKEDLYHAILDLKEDKQNAARKREELQRLMDARDDAGLFHSFARMVLASFAEDPAFHRLMLYASLEGHLLANLFRERVVLPTGDLLGKYITQRQKEGAFRQCDPKVAVMFAIGTIAHFAMSRHIFGVNRGPVGDTNSLDELVVLILGGLAQPGRMEKNTRTSGTKQQQSRSKNKVRRGEKVSGKSLHGNG